MLKRLLRHPRTQALLAALLAAYLRLVLATTRWQLIGSEHAAPVAQGAHSVIVGFWHERLPILPALWRVARRAYPETIRFAPHVLISRHRDGRLISDVVSRLGIATIEGSSSRGGAAGLLALVRLLEHGQAVGITPDGPRGPRRVAAPGVAQLAALSGVPVLPIGAATTRHRRLRSWDRMMLPLPFGRGVLVIGAPIAVPRDGVEAALPAIAAALSAACDVADAWVAAGGVSADAVPVP